MSLIAFYFIYPSKMRNCVILLCIIVIMFIRRKGCFVVAQKRANKDIYLIYNNAALNANKRV